MRMMILVAVISLGFSLVLACEDAIQEFAQSNNLFASDIYKEIIKIEKGNILVSPTSVEVVLALAQSGARHKTAKEIRSALYLPKTNDEIRSIFKGTLPNLKGDDFLLHSLNKIYVKENAVIKNKFKRIATTVYQADSENIDFTQNAQAASDINQWVEKQTDNKICNLISPDDLNALTSFILINALYFKATWRNGFFDFFTTKKEFYTIAENMVAVVDTMQGYNRILNYYENQELDARFLEMPFLDEELSMVIALPNKQDGITTLESQIDKVFGEERFQIMSLNVSIPKFKIESKINFEKILKNLGVTKAFMSEEADFSGIVDDANLYISKVMQKTFINVDEKGVEAAVASFIDIDADSRPPVASVEFIVDHPFIFYLKFKEIVLFAGRITTPLQ